MTSHVSTLGWRSELHAGLGSMTAAELLDATRRALLTIYTPQQTTVWLNVHASGDPVAVARKALRLCGLDTVGVVAGVSARSEPRGSGGGPGELADPAEGQAVRGSVAVSERVASRSSRW